MPKHLRKCLLVATIKSYNVKSGLRFALGPLVSSENVGSVFLDPTELKRTEPKIPKFRYFQFGSVYHCLKLQVSKQTGYNKTCRVILFLLPIESLGNLICTS